MMAGLARTVLSDAVQTIAQLMEFAVTQLVSAPWGSQALTARTQFARTSVLDVDAALSFHVNAM